VSGREFLLESFPGADVPGGLEIRCTADRSGSILFVSWELSGGIASVVVPPQAEVPLRKNGLWGDTCFEIFLARREFENYWEFNLSPSGDWNVFRFDSYREGMREEKAFSLLPIRVDDDGGCHAISVDIDLGKIVPADAQLEAGLSVVIKNPEGKLSYWSLSHSGPRPDFHRRDGFLIRI